MIDSIIEKYELSGTYAYLDNVTVVGTDQADHDRRLEAFLRADKATASLLMMPNVKQTKLKLTYSGTGCRTTLFDLIRNASNRL